MAEEKKKGVLGWIKEKKEDYSKYQEKQRVKDLEEVKHKVAYQTEKNKLDELKYVQQKRNMELQEKRNKLYTQRVKSMPSYNPFGSSLINKPSTKSSFKSKKPNKYPSFDDAFKWG